MMFQVKVCVGGSEITELEQRHSFADIFVISGGYKSVKKNLSVLLRSDRLVIFLP